MLSKRLEVAGFTANYDELLNQMSSVAVGHHESVEQSDRNSDRFHRLIWDYADGMEIIRAFWDVAVSLDPAAAPLHEGSRFPLCEPSALKAAFEFAGLTEVETAPLQVTAAFADFDDYWRPFLGGQGPAPAYAMSLPEAQRASLRDQLKSALPQAADGAISLRARAWAVTASVADIVENPKKLKFVELDAAQLAREAPTAAPTLAAKASIRGQFSAEPTPRPPDTMREAPLSN